MKKLVVTLVAALFAVSTAVFAQTSPAPATTTATPEAAAKKEAKKTQEAKTEKQAKTPATIPAAPVPVAAPAQATVKAVQPGLFEVAGPRVNEVVAAGIQKIAATPGGGLRAIRVQSPWGDSYFGWPKNVKPVGFTIETGKPAGGATITAPGFTDANKADYRAAIEAIVPFAVARTKDNKAFMLGSGQ